MTLSPCHGVSPASSVIENCDTARKVVVSTLIVEAASAADLTLGNEQVAAEIGADAVFVKLDVRDEGDWDTAVRTATERFGKLESG